MRFVGAAVASLILHALLMQVPLGISLPGKSGLPLPLIDTMSDTQRLFISLKPKGDATNDTLDTGKKAHEEGFQQSHVADPVIEAKTNKPGPSTQNTLEQPGLPSLTEPQPRYYIREEVDRPARMIDNINEKDGLLDKALRDTNEHGTLVIELWINDRGWVEKTEVVESILSDTTLRIIREHVERARFLPARLEHRPVSCRITLEFQVREKPGKSAENVH